MSGIDELFVQQDPGSALDHEVLEGTIVYQSGQYWAKIDNEPKLWGPIRNAGSGDIGQTVLVGISQNERMWVIASQGGDAGLLWFPVSKYGTDAAAKAAARAVPLDVIYLQRADYHFESEGRDRGDLFFGYNPSIELHPDQPDQWATISGAIVTTRGGGNRAHFPAMNLTGIDVPELVTRGVGPNNTAPYGPNQDGTGLERVQKGRGLGRWSTQGYTGKTFAGWATHIGNEAAEEFRQDALVVHLAADTEFGPTLPPHTVEIVGNLDATPSEMDGTERAWQQGGLVNVGGTQFRYSHRTATKLFDVRGGGQKIAQVFMDPEGENNKLKWFAKAFGAAGNLISVEYVDPGVPSNGLGVSLSGTDIIVSLETDAAGAIVSTAVQVQQAARDIAGIAALVNIGNKFQDSTGAGVVTAMPQTFLAGGADSTIYPAGQNLQQTQVANAGIMHFHTSQEGTNTRSERMRLHPDGSFVIGEKIIQEGAARPFFGVQGGPVEFKQTPRAQNLVAQIVGTPGTQTITYNVVGNTPGGGRTEIATLTITNAPAVLSDSNYVVLDWEAGPGVETWDVIKVSQSGGSPAVTGPIIRGQPFETSGHFAGGSSAVDRGQSAVGANEVQTVTVRYADEGTFQLMFGLDGPTDPINWDQDSATFETILEALPTIGSGNLSVLKMAADPPTWQITFQGALATTDLPLLSVVLPTALINNPNEGEDPANLPPVDVNIRERTRGGPVAYTLPTRNTTADFDLEGQLSLPQMLLPELATDPAAPDSTHSIVFAKADGLRSKLYMRDSTGVKAILDSTDSLGGGGGMAGDATTIRKTGDQTLTQSSTAFQNITDLALTLLANEIWFFQVYLDLSAQSVNADFKFDWVVPSGATYKIQRGGDASGVAAGVNPGPVATNFITIGAISGEFMARLDGFITVGSTPGSAQLRGAQNTAQAEDNKVLTNSFILGRKLA